MTTWLHGYLATWLHGHLPTWLHGHMAKVYRTETCSEIERPNEELSAHIRYKSAINKPEKVALTMNISWASICFFLIISPIRLLVGFPRGWRPQPMLIATRFSLVRQTNNPYFLKRYNAQKNIFRAIKNLTSDSFLAGPPNQ